MKIQSLTIENFMAVGSVTGLNLSDKGLILIQGNNEDDTSQASNGAGKSTIAEALCWALYGETARGESGDAVVNRTAKKGTQVEVVIQEETGDIYRISRYRKHKTYKNMLRLELQQGEGWKDLTKGTDKLTQEVVNRVVGCTHEVFASAIYAGQEAMPDLPGMTDKQLKVLVEEAAGINNLQTAFDIAKTKQADARYQLTLASNNVTSQRSNLERAKQSLDQSEQDVEEFAKKIMSDFEAKKIEVLELRSAIEPDIKGRLEKKAVEVEAEIGKLKADIAAFDAERDKESSHVRVHNSLLMVADRAQSTYDNDLKLAQQARHVFDHSDSKIGSNCGECGHVIEASDLTVAKQFAKDRAVEAARKAKQSKQELALALERAGKAAAALSEFRATMTDVSAAASSVSDLSTKLSKIKDAIRNEENKASRLKAHEFALDAFATMSNPHLASVTRFKAEIETAEAKLADLEKVQAEAQANLDVTEEAVRVFGPAGVRAHILDTVTPYLNSRTSHYLAALTDGNITAVWSTISKTAKGELREKFSIDVVSSTGAETFKGLSGGEKRKVRLACAMALQDLVSSRASKPIKIFIADEIDHALDPAGLERLMTILEEKSHDKGTVLVISHTDLRDWIRTSITITKKGGLSYLEPVCL